MRFTTLAAVVLFTGCAAGATPAQEPDMVKRSVIKNAHRIHLAKTPHDLSNGQAHARFGLSGVNSIPNFNGHYFVNGFDAGGNPNNHWYTNTAGNPPQMGKTTTIGAPIQPVNVELDDANGNLRFVLGNPLISTVTQFVDPVLGSPMFANASYGSSPKPTQFFDAIMRAEYAKQAKPDWHTLLAPRALPSVTLKISQTATCPSGPNFAGCNYVFALNDDGTCCAFILLNDPAFENGLFNVIVNDIESGAITTKDISSFLFPNTFLFLGDVTQCCVGGFHTFAFDPTVQPEPVWVFNFSSWLSPDIFPPAADVTATSHEIAETFNDPFVVSDGVHNLTPWWLAPNGVCQDGLEVGDVIEGLPNSSFVITLEGFTYHPQNVALQQWFKFEKPSDALGGAYSYPDPTVLTGPSAPQNPGCAP